MRRRPLLSALALVTVLATGCAGSPAEPPADAAAAAPDARTTLTPTPSRTPSRGAAPTAGATPSPDGSAVPATTTSEPERDPALAWMDEPPPEVDLRLVDDDYDRLVRDILQYRVWLYAHPHMAENRKRIYNPSCPCFARVGENLLQADLESLRYITHEIAIDPVEVIDRGEFSLRLRVRWQPRMTVEAFTGGVREEGWGRARDQEWFLFQGNSGSYRIAGMDNL